MGRRKNISFKTVLSAKYLPVPKFCNNICLKDAITSSYMFNFQKLFSVFRLPALPDLYVFFVPATQY